MKDYNNTSVNANQISGLTTITGQLCFLKEGYYFKAQGVNSVINNPLIAYKDIAEVKGRNTLGFIPNGISVYLRNGIKYDYAVLHRNDIKAYMESKIKATQG